MHAGEIGGAVDVLATPSAHSLLLFTVAVLESSVLTSCVLVVLRHLKVGTCVHKKLAAVDELRSL